MLLSVCDCKFNVGSNNDICFGIWFIMLDRNIQDIVKILLVFVRDYIQYIIYV